jgi:hypothetical protein
MGVVPQSASAPHSEGGITVFETHFAPIVALALAVVVIGFEQLVQWRYGAMGVVGLTMLAVGVKAKNVTCSCIGAVVLAMLLAQ